MLDAYPDWQIPAKVITMVPTADRQKATVLVRIGFNALDPRILPDMGIKVTFLREADAATAAAQPQPVTLVPAAAVRTDNDTKVRVRRAARGDGRAARRADRHGRRRSAGSEGGTQGGDRVVVSPPPDIEDGAAVVVK